MKTTIELSDYDFGNRQLIQQISDDPVTGLARVIVFDRFEVLDDIKHLRIQGRMHYINQETNQLLPKFTHVTLSKGEEWIVSNDYDNIEVGLDGNPVPNLDYDDSLPESDENLPYLLQPAYDNFSKIIFALLSQLVTASVAQDDSRGYFNEVPNEENPW